MIRPMIMPYEGKTVPHAVLEVNQKCNISCRACYKNKMNYTKPKEKVMEEIDFLVSKRRLYAITLAGGEPVLHPDLPEIIEHIAERGVVPNMLSNGRALDDALLSKYGKAGLKEILLHIDMMQTRSDAANASCEGDLNPLRRELAERVVRHGITCSMELTLYQENLRELKSVVDFVLANPNIYRLLITCCTNFERIAAEFRCARILGGTYRKTRNIPHRVSSDEGIDGQTVQLNDVERLLNEIGMKPFAYVASSENPRTKRWVFHYSFVINFKDGEYKTLHIGPGFKRLVKMFYAVSKAMGRPLSFSSVYSSRTCVFICLLYALFSFNVKEFFRTLSFLVRLFIPGSHIHHKSFTFQQGPTCNEDGGIEYCKDCPDATVRNGTMVPVCLADYLFPLAEEPTGPACAVG